MRPYLITLHGFWRSKYSMTPLALYFKSKGYQTINYWYNSYTQDYQTVTEKLADKIKSNIPTQAEIYFIGHSLGGLIIRILASKLNNQYKLRRAVLLGTPNQGSALAQKLSESAILNLLLGPNLKMLATTAIPDEPSLELGVIAGKLRSGGSLVPWHNEENDGIVTVSETMLPALKDFYLLKTPHSLFMFDPRVYRLTENFLKTGSFNQD